MNRGESLIIAHQTYTDMSDLCKVASHGRAGNSHHAPREGDRRPADGMASRDRARRRRARRAPPSEAGLPPEYPRIVAISRSGTTTEVRQALAALAGRIPVTAIVGDAESPIAGAADEVIDLSFADDRSVVQSRFVTTVACLARAALGEDVAALPDAAAAALAAPVPLV